MANTIVFIIILHIFLFCPAVFTYDQGRDIAVKFPDLGVATSGSDDDDALMSARELLGCALFGMEEDEKDIPVPTLLVDVAAEPKEHTVDVGASMPSVRQAQSSKAVSPTVTLPAWLNALAIEHDVNFSQTPQAALREQLNAEKQSARAYGRQPWRGA